MAGLLSAAGAAPPQPMAAQPMAAEPDGDEQNGVEPAGPEEQGEAPNVTPEEQAQYDAFVTNGLDVIYDEKQKSARPDILNRLKESSDPIENLANTSVWLVTMLETSAEQGGQQLDDAVVMHGGQALLEELAEVSEAAKIHDFTEDEIQGAWYRALDLYRETATESGRVDPEQLKQQFGEIQAADEEGRMGEVLPGIENAPAGEQPPTQEG